jgi:hypothetical protein
MNVTVDGTQLYANSQDTINTVLKIYQGTHNLVVNAMDSAHGLSSSAINVVAEPNDSPPTISAIQVTPLPAAGANTLLLCGAEWQDSHAFVNAYRWSFSDNSAQAFTPGIVHTFPAAGTYSIKLELIDQFGAPASITQNVTATGAAAAGKGGAVHVQSPETQRQNLPIRLPRLP